MLLFGEPTNGMFYKIRNKFMFQLGFVFSLSHVTWFMSASPGAM